MRVENSLIYGYSGKSLVVRGFFVIVIFIYLVF